MKALFYTFAVVFVMGCGSVCSVSGQSDGEDRDDHESPPPPPAETGPVATASQPAGQGGKLPDITCMWENSSCGERKYRRQINFFEDGRFDALDEVAPCPPGKSCVWSGIIKWTGNWTLKDRVIALEIKQQKDEKIPENAPSEFQVVDDDPVSIGELNGEVICPYQKSK